MSKLNQHPGPQLIFQVPITKDGGKVEYVDVPHAFLGGIGKFFGNVGKGLADAVLTPFGGGNLIKDSGFDKIPGLSHALGFLGDQTLGAFDVATNTVFGQDFIKDGAYTTGIGSKIGNKLGNLGNSFGAYAAPAIGAAFGIPPHLSSAIRGFSGSINGGNGFSSNTPQNIFGIDPNSMRQVLGQTPFGSGYGSPFGGLAGIGTPGFTGLGGAFGGMAPLLSLMNMGGNSGLMDLLGGGIARYGKGGPVHGWGQTASYERGMGKMVSRSSQRIPEKDLKVDYINNPEPFPIQTEEVNGLPEQIIFPSGHITDVNARRSHKEMMEDGDENVVTDLVTGDAYIASAYGGITIKKADAEKIELSIKVDSYNEHKRGNIPVVNRLSDTIFKKDEKEITPAEAVKRIKAKFPLASKKDIFAQFTDDLNLNNRKKYLGAIIALSEYAKNKKELANEKRKLTNQLKTITDSESTKQIVDMVSPEIQKPTVSIFKKGGKVSKKKKGYKYPTGGGVARLPFIGENPIVGRQPTLDPTVVNNYMAANPTGGGFSNILSGLGNIFGGSGTGSPSVLDIIGQGLAIGGGLGGAINNFGTGRAFGNLLNTQSKELEEFAQSQSQALMGARMFNILPSLAGPDVPLRELRDKREFISPTAYQAIEQAGIDNFRGDLLSTLRLNNNNPYAFQALNARAIEGSQNALIQSATNRFNREQNILDSNYEVDSTNQDISFANRLAQFEQTNNRLNNMSGNLSGSLLDQLGVQQGLLGNQQSLALQSLLGRNSFRDTGFQSLLNLGALLKGIN